MLEVAIVLGWLSNILLLVDNLAEDEEDLSVGPWDPDWEDAVLDIFDPENPALRSLIYAASRSGMEEAY